MGAPPCGQGMGETSLDVSDASDSSTIFVVTPMFNDWGPAQRLLGELDAVAEQLGGPLSVVVVNDGSTESGRFEPEFIDKLSNIQHVELLNLVSNLGHARALGVGLSYVAREKAGAAVVVMDCDGEDQPSDVRRMVDAFQQGESRVIVAQRVSRSEGMIFRAFYQIYKGLFRLLTGEVISFGNFCLIPRAILDKLIFAPDLWNHLGACLVRSPFPIAKLPTARGKRYAGRSKMNLVSLIQLGLGAIAVDLERVLVRILLALGLFIFALVTGMALVAGIRFTTDLAIPGWASNVFGALAILLLQSSVFAILLLFIALKNRAIPMSLPAQRYREFLAEVIRLKG
jgi:glycosyltransferase involved in cell wall biosynthesis